jgi:hypothetical protein
MYISIFSFSFINRILVHVYINLLCNKKTERIILIQTITFIVDMVSEQPIQIVFSNEIYAKIALPTKI